MLYFLDYAVELGESALLRRHAFVPQERTSTKGIIGMRYTSYHTLCKRDIAPDFHDRKEYADLPRKDCEGCSSAVRAELKSLLTFAHITMDDLLP